MRKSTLSRGSDQHDSKPESRLLIEDVAIDPAEQGRPWSSDSPPLAEIDELEAKAQDARLVDAAHARIHERPVGSAAKEEAESTPRLVIDEWPLVDHTEDEELAVDEAADVEDYEEVDEADEEPVSLTQIEDETEARCNSSIYRLVDEDDDAVDYEDDGAEAEGEDEIVAEDEEVVDEDEDVEEEDEEDDDAVDYEDDEVEAEGEDEIVAEDEEVVDEDEDVEEEDDAAVDYEDDEVEAEDEDEVVAEDDDVVGEEEAVEDDALDLVDEEDEEYADEDDDELSDEADEATKPELRYEDAYDLAEEDEEFDAEEIESATIGDDSETIGGLIREAIEAKATIAVEDAIEGREPAVPVRLRIAIPEETDEIEPPERDETPQVKVAAAAAPQLPPPGEIAKLGVRRSTLVPKRIGSGRLVPARLTWKPGDPFATPSAPKRSPFRWELMLTSACITAVCGLGCVWLLRNLLT